MLARIGTPPSDQTALNRRHAMAGRPLRILTACFLLEVPTAPRMPAPPTQHDLLQIRDEVASYRRSTALKGQAAGPRTKKVDGRRRDQAAEPSVRATRRQPIDGHGHPVKGLSSRGDEYHAHGRA